MSHISMKGKTEDLNNIRDDEEEILKTNAELRKKRRENLKIKTDS